MTLEDVIILLKSAEKGTRDLDLEVARVVGWTVETNVSVDTKTGKNVTNVRWMTPENPLVTGRVPRYTTDLQAAYELAIKYAPAVAGGCSWEAGAGSAMFIGFPRIEAKTPQVALCVAALLCYRRSSRA